MELTQQEYEQLKPFKHKWDEYKRTFAANLDDCANLLLTIAQRLTGINKQGNCSGCLPECLQKCYNAYERYETKLLAEKVADALLEEAGIEKVMNKVSEVSLELDKPITTSPEKEIVIKDNVTTIQVGQDKVTVLKFKIKGTKEVYTEVPCVGYEGELELLKIRRLSDNKEFEISQKTNRGYIKSFKMKDDYLEVEVGTIRTPLSKLK